MTLHNTEKKVRTYSKWVFRLMQLILLPLIKMLHRPVILGGEHMPTTGPCFIISNHSNLIDAFFINYRMRSEPTAGIMTEEYFRGGPLSFLFKKIGVVATRKFFPQTTPVREIVRYIRDNRMLIIMPEGERNWDGVTLPTVPSTGKLFRRLQVPVHPVTVHNSYSAWPRWAIWPRPARITVEFHTPLNFSDKLSDEEAAAWVDRAVLWSAEEDIIRYPQARWAFRPADGITNLLFRCPDCGDDRHLSVRRGRFLSCKSCDSEWRVGADSVLTNMETGQKRSSTAVFRRIIEMPREERAFGTFGKALAGSLNNPVYEEITFPHQIPLGRCTCLLRSDAVDIIPRGKTDPIHIPLNRIQSTSIEKKYKLQLRLEDRLYQINFRQASALQWELYLKDLCPSLASRALRRTPVFLENAATGSPGSIVAGEKDEVR